MVNFVAFVAFATVLYFWVAFSDVALRPYAGGLNGGGL